jgi:hypothetical protein
MSTQDNRASVADGRGTWRKEYHTMGLMRIGRPRRALRILGSWLTAGVLIGTQLAIPVAQAAQTAPAAAPAVALAAVAQTSTIKLAVTAARTEPRALGGVGVTKGDAVTKYKWMINEDNTGTTVQRDANPGSGCSSQDVGYPDSCKWTSIAGLASSAPVAAQGDETTLNGTTGIASLKPGRYLISVLADGFKLDGAPFTVPMDVPGVVEVPLQPSPLPTATIKAQVFADVTGANGPVRPGRGRPARIRRVHHRLHRPGDHRRLRQPPVHRVRLHRREPQRVYGPRRDQPGPGAGLRADRHPHGRQVPVG